MGLPPLAAAALRRMPLCRDAVLAWRRLHDRCADVLLNIATVPAADPAPRRRASRFGDAHGFAHLQYGLIACLMRTLPLSPDDVFMDLGCGKGRTLCLFARRPIRKCIGVEIDPELAGIAAANARRLRGRRCPIEIVRGDAADADFSQASIVWLFNPFGDNTTRYVVERIRASLLATPRRVRIMHVRGPGDDAPDFGALLGCCMARDITVPSFSNGRAKLLDCPWAASADALPNRGLSCR